MRSLTVQCVMSSVVVTALQASSMVQSMGVSLALQAISKLTLRYAQCLYVDMNVVLYDAKIWRAKILADMANQRQFASLIVEKGDKSIAK